ncbi:MAG: helix-turn-helix transcriptional regulator, partial [Clostridia bacterium]|nr:helix-turn-helix transcriptional regulator [Clostridia bacterium]
MQRKLKSLTQEGLAEMADISVSFVGHLERGEKIPSIETIIKIAERLDMELNYLLIGRLKCEQKNCPIYERIRNMI